MGDAFLKIRVEIPALSRDFLDAEVRENPLYLRAHHFNAFQKVLCVVGIPRGGDRHFKVVHRRYELLYERLHGEFGKLLLFALDFAAVGVEIRKGAHVKIFVFLGLRDRLVEAAHEVRGVHRLFLGAHVVRGALRVSRRRLAPGNGFKLRRALRFEGLQIAAFPAGGPMLGTTCVFVSVLHSFGKSYIS